MEESRPAVAVIVPCFNDGATVREAVDSARAETVPHELVVVDDGSSDPKTLAVFDQLEAEGVRVLHQENRGLAEARMAGMRATRAPLVFPLDADDTLLPGGLSALVQTLKENPGLAVTWGDYQVFGQREYVQGTADRLDAWHITHQNDLPVAALFRRDALVAAGGWELRGGYEDWDLWMSLAAHGYAGARTPVVAYRYRVHGRRMLADSATRHGEILQVLRTRHPELFAQRRKNWSRSGAPLSLRLSLPIIERLPTSRTSRRLLAGAACHLAHRRSLKTLALRARSA